MIILFIATVFYSSDSVPLESVVICCKTVATLNMLSRDYPPDHSGTTDWLTDLLTYLLRNWLTDSQTDYGDLSLCCLLKHFFRRPHLGLLRLRLRISADCHRKGNCWGCVQGEEHSPSWIFARKVLCTFLGSNYSFACLQPRKKKLNHIPHDILIPRSSLWDDAAYIA
jgi:hypothetical protein